MTHTFHGVVVDLPNPRTIPNPDHHGAAMSTPNTTPWTALLEPIGGSALQLTFHPAPPAVVDMSPVTLDGGVTVWFDPLDPDRPHRMIIPDLRAGAFSAGPLLGEQAFGTARDLFQRITDSDAPVPGVEVTVPQSALWAGLARWALAAWLRDGAPTDLDPELLDVEIATNASTAAVLLDHEDLDRLERRWQSVTERLLILARRCTDPAFSKVAHRGVVDLVGRAVRAATEFLDPDDDERTAALAALAPAFPAPEQTAALDRWLDQLYVDEVFARMIAPLGSSQTSLWQEQNASVTLAAAQIAATLIGDGVSAGTTGISATDSVDWWQVPPRTLADDEGTVRWTWNAATHRLLVEVPADQRAIHDGRWREDLRFQVADDSGDPAALASGPLEPKLGDGVYRGEVAAALARPTDRIVIDVFARRAGSDPVPALGDVRLERAARRAAARGTAASRRLRLLHGVRALDRETAGDVPATPTGGWPSRRPSSLVTVRYQLVSRAETVWQAAANGYAGLQRRAEEQRCIEQMDAPHDQVLVGVQEPTLAEYDLLDLLSG